MYFLLFLIIIVFGAIIINVMADKDKNKPLLTSIITGAFYGLVLAFIIICAFMDLLLKGIRK